MSSLTTAGSGEECSAEEFDTHLSLGIGGGGRRPPARRQTVQLFGEVLSLQDQRHGRHGETTAAAATASGKKRESGIAAASHNRKARTPKQAAGENDGGDSRGPSEGGGGRKKLRLTSVQASLLDGSFRAHNILSHAEKHELARLVGLSARQVEVWFQNRRARTKLKQTEVDCDLLRRWCDRLTDENACLRRDLADLRAAAAGGVVVCPSCCGKKIAIVAGGDVA